MVYQEIGANAMMTMEKMKQQFYTRVNNHENCHLQPRVPISMGNWSSCVVCGWPDRFGNSTPVIVSDFFWSIGSNVKTGNNQLDVKQIMHQSNRPNLSTYWDLANSKWPCVSIVDGSRGIFVRNPGILGNSEESKRPLEISSFNPTFCYHRKPWGGTNCAKWKKKITCSTS